MYWFLSYAAEDGFRGGFVVEGPDFFSACKRVIKLGLSPGGQVLGDPVPDGVDPVKIAPYLDRKLSSAECQSMFETDVFCSESATALLGKLT